MPSPVVYDTTYSFRRCADVTYNDNPTTVPFNTTHMIVLFNAPYSPIKSGDFKGTAFWAHLIEFRVVDQD